MRCRGGVWDLPQVYSWSVDCSPRCGGSPGPESEIAAGPRATRLALKSGRKAAPAPRSQAGRPRPAGQPVLAGCAGRPPLLPASVQPSLGWRDRLASVVSLEDAGLPFYYLPPLLDEEFQWGSRYLPRWSPHGRATRSRFSPLQLRYMLWARSTGTTVAAIASAVRCTERAVYARLAVARDDPNELLRCRFVQRVHQEHLRGGERWYCRGCGLLAKEAQRAARHAWRHVFGARRQR